MTNQSLVYSLRRDRNRPSDIRRQLIKVVKSPIYADTAILVTTFDESARSKMCAQRFFQLNPLRVYNENQLNSFIYELNAIHNEALRCTINPYFYRRTRVTRHVTTLGDIIIQNASVPMPINTLIVNSQFNYIDKPKLIKECLIKWNREAKDYLERAVEEKREYLAKAHVTKCYSIPLAIACFLSFVACLFTVLSFASTEINETTALYVLIVFGGFAIVSIANAVVNSFHSRNLRKYDIQMKKLDRLFEKYTDHSFNVEKTAMKKVQRNHLCNVPLSRMNVIDSAVGRFNIEDYVHSENYLSHKKYWFLKFLAFFGFIGSMVCAYLFFML